MLSPWGQWYLPDTHRNVAGNITTRRKNAGNALEGSCGLFQQIVSSCSGTGENSKRYMKTAGTLSVVSATPGHKSGRSVSMCSIAFMFCLDVSELSPALCHARLIAFRFAIRLSTRQQLHSSFHWTPDINDRHTCHVTLLSVRGQRFFQHLSDILLYMNRILHIAEQTLTFSCITREH